MTKDQAIRLLGAGSPAAAARALGIVRQSLNSWPEELPQRLVDRVQAALWRQSQGMAHPEPAGHGGLRRRADDAMAA